MVMHVSVVYSILPLDHTYLSKTTVDYNLYREGLMKEEDLFLEARIHASGDTQSTPMLGGINLLIPDRPSVQGFGLPPVWSSLSVTKGLVIKYRGWTMEIEGWVMNFSSHK